MRNVRILDCTLRDGGRVIDCAFPDYEIRELVQKLTDAKIDIVEVGFLRDWRRMDYQRNSTFFTDVDQIKPFLDKNKKNTMYVAFVDHGMFDFDSLKPYDGMSINGIRYGFTKEDYRENRKDIIRCARIIKEKGYQLFIQGVNSLNYSDREFLELVDMVNDIHPYSFGIVDTYGAMYMDDVARLFGLVNHNMRADICIDFHSHNNYQLSFALAQEIIKLSHGIRQIIIDSTLSGMGKAAGNLNTELLADYLIRKLNYGYEFDNILDMIDEHIYKYTLNHRWGYSIPAMMAGIYKSHPNNIIYLTEKFRLDTKDIGKLLSMIEPKKRQKYDYDNIELLYIKYIADKIDDSENINKLRKMIGNREVVVLVPGDSLNTYRSQISCYIKDIGAYVVSINFIADLPYSTAFFGNQKRYNKLSAKRGGRTILISSNVKSNNDRDLIFNYHSLIDRGYKYFENSTIMFLHLLKRIGTENISLAGFDGFKNEKKSNYADESFQNERYVHEFDTLNNEIMQMFSDFSESVEGKCRIRFITPSRFEKVKK